MTIPVLLLTNADSPAELALTRALCGAGLLAVETSSDGDRLRGLEPGAIVVAAIDPSRPFAALSASSERALIAHVSAGGGLLVTGGTLDAWREHARLLDLLGRPRGDATPLTEIIAHPTEHDALTRRLDERIAFADRVTLLVELPTCAVPLLATTSRLRPATLAYRLAVGDGCVVVFGVGRESGVWAVPALGQLAGRAVKALAGQVEGAPVRVGMIGYGAIGREHGSAIGNVAGLELAVVCDRVQARLDQARDTFPDVRVTSDLREVSHDPNVDAVIVSTPPNTHAAIAEIFLRAGKHVVLEKPFCLKRDEADRLIALAAESQRALTVYQCRRWDADYLAIREVVASGTIGDIFHVETFIGGFAHPCDFWHSDADVSGGAVFDWGSHYLDWVLELVPDRVTSVTGVEHKRVWHDVTNADQTHVALRFAGGQEADLVQSDIAAALKPKWYILGTRGALVADWRRESVKSREWSGNLIEEVLAPAESPAAVSVMTCAATGEIHTQLLALPTPPPFSFHRNLANHLHNSEPLAVDAASARRNVVVMEAARDSARQGGQPIPVEA